MWYGEGSSIAVFMAFTEVFCGASDKHIVITERHIQNQKEQRNETKMAHG